jgi:hypothetical protein
MAENEEELLGSEYISAKNQLFQQANQMGGGFYQLARETDFEERYPNAIDDFLKSESVAEIADKAGVGIDALKPPIDISDETISQIDTILNSADPLNMTDDQLETVRSDVDDIVGNTSVPTADELTAFINAYSQFVSNASAENISFPTNTREITLVSTDTTLDNFIARTGVRKLIIIRINNLVYPFITNRYKVPSDKQADLTGIMCSEGEYSIDYTAISKVDGSTTIKPGSIILITNNAKKLENLEQQKTGLEWISEESKTIQLKDPLLFDIDSDHVVQIYQYTDNQILAPGEMIKIPQ